ncbi:MAG: SiaC family regulatory phosphoprotein [Bacteroidota bacterium]
MFSNQIINRTEQMIGLVGGVRSSYYPDQRQLNINYLTNLNLITIRGWSIAQNIQSKYDELLLTIDGHLETKNNLNIHCKYELFNSSSLKCILNMIKKLNQHWRAGRDVKIFWSITDGEDEMLEMGLDLRGLCDFRFQISCL